MAVASPEAEQYRSICSRLEQMHKERGLQTMAISSPIAGDGKTMTAINVAGTLAQFPETKVILIDMDFRRPAVSKYLGISDGYSTGLGSLIDDPQLNLSKVVRQYSPFSLNILPAGQPSRTPHEVLKSRRLLSVLQEARSQYDYVILDLPPMLFPDSRLLEHLVDGFVLVISAHKTPRKLVEESLNLLHPDKICGIILNNDDRPLFGYYSYYSYYYYNRPFPDERVSTLPMGTAVKNVFSNFRNWTIWKKTLKEPEETNEI
jgi:receptor protein-tyrosine kinase/non-specific protein-tyrosine kinase